MSRDNERVASARAGWAELRNRRWEAARASFGAALAEEETPEALEGLSWAAWWLDQPDKLAALDGEFLDFATRANRGAPGGPAQLTFEYLLVVARKR